MNILLWILVAVLVAVGVAGTVLPALPGAILVFAGVLLAAWIDDFTRISGWTVGIVGVLTLLAFATDWVAAALGAKKVGASRQALVGATIGTIAGVFTGLWGLIFMPLVGAAVGELVARPDLRHASKVGFATWLGMAIGTVVKVALVLAMVGILLFALFV
jgi:uncharacterized protein YqgC (DUF456 family)